MNNHLSCVRQLDKKYHCHFKQNKRYRFNGSGCRETINNLFQAVYRTAIYVGLLSKQKQQSYIIMVTASHNPSSDNGIKIGKLNQQIVSKQILVLIETGLNSDQEFFRFTSDKIIKCKDQTPSKRIYLGRDCRQSSPQFINIVKQALQAININTFIDTGVCSTPQLWSFSQYLQKSLHNDEQVMQSVIENYHQAYTSQILTAFNVAWKIATKEQETNKQKILFDFSNGCGAISYKPYHQTLSQYFQIKAINDSDFKNPNYQCGSAYMQQNWEKEHQLQKYKHFDYCIFFDGDSDRVIIKLKNQAQCFDGNSLTILCLRTLQKIFSSLSHQLYHQLCSKANQKVWPTAVVNFQANLGLIETIKTENFEIQISQVGVQNLYAKAAQKTISVFFQTNGHGGIYMNKILRDFIQCNLQSKDKGILLLSYFYQISRNNCRGYALHNFLLFTLCSEYLFGHNSSQKLCNLYNSYQQVKYNIYIDKNRINQFQNQNNQQQMLKKPQVLVSNIRSIQKKYSGYQIILRKSITQANIVRINIQGNKKQTCQRILEQVNFNLQQFKLTNH